jgi:ribosomal protein S18 acetylase RimI-like enzyme
VGGAVAVAEDQLRGFVSMEIYSWNRLAQIHGLAVDPAHLRSGIGSELVAAAECFGRAAGARGIYADTPVTNVAARAFYVAAGYVEDYVMTRYADDLDGVAFVKFFELTDQLSR